MSRQYWPRLSGGLVALALASLSVHPQGISRTVTLADYGETIQLQVGDRFLLDLDSSGYNWMVKMDAPSIVTRMGDAQVSNQAQGVYEAQQPGETVLTAEGRPSCPDPRQACP